ncbi:hypothetical protein RB593_007329 [Gaeumannomyces tritici]
MSVPFSQILQEATTNPAHVTGYRSGTGKDWANRYPLSLIPDSSRIRAQVQVPQIFCLDGEILLLLQFRADTPDHIQREDCRVDCWVIPRENAAGGCTLRQGLHNLLVQGFRRCQGYAAAPNLSVNHYTSQYREFFSGRPVFTHDNGALSYEHPQNGHNDVFDREVDVNDGSVYWRRNGNYLVHDTGSIWG